ncbi:hypothetical protein GCM10023185_02780 [Hymenobacter saemangeumensis]|uniref:Carboxypeptidase-like regulatory domain-containing protein n=1 Tax=Hymenobacter saemangeumensis TaxID=1084522 RepID=A0ABP8HYI5_9BACT
MRLTIPQPCQENWTAMRPAGNGRHCESCQTTVIDFTQQSDAEILAYLGRAAGGRICGRFAAGQLERPLQRAAPAALGRWRAWLAAAVALWGLREVSGSEAKAQAPTEQRAVPSGSHLEYSARPDYEGQVKARVLRGRIVDFQTRESLPGVSIIIKGTTIGTQTNADGTFELSCPIEITNSQQAIALQYIGYAFQELAPTPGQWYGDEMVLKMQIEMKGGISGVKPWPWHPRTFYYWAKWQLTRPFQK